LIIKLFVHRPLHISSAVIAIDKSLPHQEIVETLEIPINETGLAGQGTGILPL